MQSQCARAQHILRLSIETVLLVRLHRTYLIRANFSPFSSSEHFHLYSFHSFHRCSFHSIKLSNENTLSGQGACGKRRNVKDRSKHTMWEINFTVNNSMAQHSGVLRIFIDFQKFSVRYKLWYWCERCSRQTCSEHFWQLLTKADSSPRLVLSLIRRRQKKLFPIYSPSSPICSIWRNKISWKILASIIFRSTDKT